MSDINRNEISENEEFINIKDIMFLCLANWKWFVLSLAITLSLGCLYILSTPPEYTRNASILIKDDKKGGSIGSEMQAFADMGLFQSNVNVHNELIALKSPATITEVVKRLSLNTNYYYPGFFHDQTAYGESLPVTVSLDNLTDNDAVSFTFDVENNQFTITDLMYKDEDVLDGGELAGSIPSIIDSPLGKISVKPTPYFVSDTTYSMDVVRSSVYSTVKAYTENLSIALSTKEATVIDLSIKDVSIQRAVDVLNALISVYNEKWVQDKNQIAVSTSMFINDRLQVIESDLGNVDKNISEYKSENLLTDVQAASNLYMTQSAQTNAQILALNNQLYMANYIKEYLSDEGNRFQLLPANSGIENANIESQIDKYNTQMLQRNNLVSNSSTQNPLVIDMDKALEGMRYAVMASIDNQVVTLKNQIRSLQASDQQTTSRLAANPTQAKHLLSVERQQKVKEALYLFLLQKREENELSQAFTAYNTRIITPPYGSMLPTAPVKMNIMLIAFMMGLIIPGGIIFVREAMNTKVRGRKDLENLSIPLVGEIPQMQNGKVSTFDKLMGKKPKEERQIVVKKGERDIINEAFRVLRTNLEFVKDKTSSSNVMIVTSFNPGSGKSFISINTALSLAINKKKVLVIDGDMRHASSSAYVGSPKKGLSDYLSGSIGNVEEVIVKDREVEGYHVLPVGTIPPNPSELLSLDRMEELVNDVKERYDYVIIDCPPIELVADTHILEKMADRTVFIVRAGVLEKGMLSELQSMYTRKKYKNMTLILNGTESNANKYGYRYGYRYGYHYGYGYGYQYGGEQNKK